MKVVILQSNYVPWKGYFDLINDADTFVFYDCVKYTKNDWRNRNQIATKNGNQWLTIPMPGNAVNMAIDEAVIEDKKWQDTHYKSLYFAYKKAPFFPQLEELIELYLKQHQWQKLSALNQFVIKHIATKIGINTNFIDSRELAGLEGDRVERLISILTQLNATEYISGQAAKDYMTGHEHLFSDKGIHLTYKLYPQYPVYTQLSPEFSHFVSILDMVAHLHWDEIKHYIYAPLP